MSRKFLIAEKKRQYDVKSNTSLFSPDAKRMGTYKSKSYDFCLPVENADENLFDGIRKQAIDVFRSKGIHWHDGKDAFPSTHLCDSQVCCLNFLFPLTEHPHALASLLKPYYPSVKEMLSIEDNLYVTFEWIGATDYLKESIRTKKKRTRGANCTSADAAVKFRLSNGKIQVVLIEWKYTESYSPFSLKTSKNGTDRTEVYQKLYDANSCPLNKSLIPGFEDLFYEPFYQFMRQQFLANEMEKAHELGADVVSVLHIAPRHNTDFLTVTSHALKDIGDSAINVWKKLVNDQDKFLSVATEDMFGKFNAVTFPELQDWYHYITTRYSWVIQ